MKNFILLLCLLFTFIFSLSGQTKKSSIGERSEKADLIFEGKVISQESFWDDKKTGIFTESTIEISKMFKGAAVNTIFKRSLIRLN